MLKKLKSNWPIVFLLLISLILCVANYSPGTFLSGWDTLHPEFNFGLAFNRAFFGVFRIEQGLGAVAAHSHMADLPRIVILYLFHFITPLSFLRYSYVFLNMIFGTLGMYFLLNKHFLKNQKASFLGALFYLLNLGTIQTFNVPFEMFTTLFATLPFMFYFASSYILDRENRTKNLFFFAISALFNSPSAYASTLWFVLFLCFSFYFLTLSVINYRKDKHHLKHFFILIFVFILINLFWLIPDIYFILNHGKEVANANINKLFSDQAFLKNKEFGNLKDILFLKSFYFDWNIYQGNNNFIDLLTPYISHLKDIKVLSIGYLFAISFILGIFVSIKKLKTKSIPLLGVLLISLFFLINDNFPTSLIFNFFKDHVPFFKESLRFPGDKILNIYVFLISIFFGYFCLSIIERINKFKLKLENIFLLLISFLIIFYTLPAFSGNFINDKMRVNIPNQYFQLFNYLDTKPQNLRIANLPIQSQWGWTYYNWGYQGAGFLYFGIKQPLLDRDFDRWSPYNESYYREMSYAIYKNDSKLLINVVKKYKIGIIFIDKDVSSPQNPDNILYFEQSKKLIQKTGLFKDSKKFGNIEVFEIKNNAPLVETLNTNINTSPLSLTTYHDFSYELFGNYVSMASSPLFSNVFFPFRDLIDNQSKLHKNIVSLKNDKITLNPFGNITSFNSSLLSETINLIPSNLITQKSKNILTVSFYPETPIFDNLSSSTPIKIGVDITNTKQGVLMSLNQNQLFNINNLNENTPLAAGTVLLKNSDNQISFFNQAQEAPIDNFINIINPYFLSCEGNELTPNIGFSKEQINIKAKNQTCIIVPFKYLSKNQGSLITNLKFEFLGNAKITSCLYDLNTSTCIYNKDPERFGNFVSFSFVLNSSQTQNLALKIFLQPPNTKENTYILKNLSSSYIKSFADIKISKEQIANIFVKNNNISFNKMYLPKSIIYDPGFEVTAINNFQNDCISPNSKAKKNIILENNKKIIRYYSPTGSFCDHFSYQNLPHSQGYLIAVNSKNVSGLPLSLCVSNYVSKRCDIYSDLSQFKNFGRDVFLLPPMDDNGNGYNISFENLGINKSPSQNLISGIEIIPIPYEFISSIKTQSKVQNKFLGSVNNVIKYNPSFYIVELSKSPSLLSLNYSFEQGFRAYYVSCNSNISCFIKGFMAPFYAKVVSEHVLVNAWANGWVIETQNSKINNQKIAIVFLPQYFEYLGITILILVISTLSFKLKKRTHHNP